MIIIAGLNGNWPSLSTWQRASQSMIQVRGMNGKHQPSATFWDILPYTKNMPHSARIQTLLTDKHPSWVTMNDVTLLFTANYGIVVQTRERTNGEPANWSFWLPLSAGNTPKRKFPYLERLLLFFFFIKRGIICNQYTAASYEMRACSTDVSCLSLLSDSLAPHLHPHLRWHFSASARIKVVYWFTRQYQEHVVVAGGGGGGGGKEGVHKRSSAVSLSPSSKKTCSFVLVLLKIVPRWNSSTSGRFSSRWQRPEANGTGQEHWCCPWKSRARNVKFSSAITGGAAVFSLAISFVLGLVSLAKTRRVLYER